MRFSGTCLHSVKREQLIKKPAQFKLSNSIVLFIRTVSESFHSTNRRYSKTSEHFDTSMECDEHCNRQKRKEITKMV